MELTSRSNSIDFNATILRNTLNAETSGGKGLGHKIHQRFMSANVEMPELSKRDDLPRAAEFDT